VRPFAGRTIVLGVTGGIAAYKAVMLARLLTQSGAFVDVVMTRSATQFVGAVTFEALTGRPVYDALVAPGHALDHIKLAKRADLVIVAPATADFLARAARGHADDLLAAVLLATAAPVMIAPAMNDQMWAHPQVRNNTAHLRTLGYSVVDPDVGPLAQGEGSGAGRLPEPDTLLAHAARVLDRDTRWTDRRVVITAGPTREAIDPVRFLTNHSTGRMGVALATAAWQRGAHVTLIHGPLEVALPVGVHTQAVTSTVEMRDAVARALPAADVLIMAAAPADFAAATVAEHKLSKRADGAPALPLTHTPDILRTTLAHRKPGAVVVGFALETDDLDRKALHKLAEKQLDLIIGNDASQEGAGFGTDTNIVTIFDKDGGREALPIAAKIDVAHTILDRIAVRMVSR
jgi:phosphopantothenoylcysteine decarboxylase / phosphopantothenate---cysteine ligase